MSESHIRTPRDNDNTNDDDDEETTYIIPPLTARMHTQGV